MDDLKKLYDRLSDLWAVVFGVVGGVTAIWRVYRVYGARIWRAVLLSDAIHIHFGPKAATAFIADFQNSKRDGIILESRLQLVENKLDLAGYVCSASGECEWVNSECAELLGIERINCLGFGWIEGIEATERTRVHSEWMHAVAHKLPYECRYTVHNRRSGKKTICVTFAFPHITSGGKLICYVGHLTPENKTE